MIQFWQDLAAAAGILEKSDQDPDACISVYLYTSIQSKIGPFSLVGAGILARVYRPFLVDFSAVYMACNTGIL